MNQVIINDSPHTRGKRTTRGIMLDVIIALIPVTIMGCVYFGWKALVTVILSVLSAVLTEFVYLLITKKTLAQIIAQFDFTSIITGLLLALTLNANTPFYVPVLASIFAIAVTKMMFGGTGKNIVNPAIAGRVFAFIAFTSVMTSNWANVLVPAIHGEVSTGATVLTTLLQEGLDKVNISNLDLFLGTGVTGCIGETCKIALVIGYIYLVIRKVIKWQWPVIYIVVTGLMSVALNKFDFAYFMPSILSGGLFLGAIFMATDYTTSPHCDKASYIYYILLGIVTAALRKATSIEVVSFAILLMNLVVPLLNVYVRPHIFGAPTFIQKVKAKQQAKKAAKAEKEAK